MKNKFKNYMFCSFIFSLIVSCSKDPETISSKNVCQEKLPNFTEKFDGKYNVEKLKVLCSCIWNKFPENGWERKVSIKLYNDEDIGWKIKSFSTVFEANLKYCKKNSM